MKRVHVFVSGRVQGVFFRSETERIARERGLAGWVRNLRDGRVEAVFEGLDADVDSAVAWCHEGPKWARVDWVELTQEGPEGASEFRMR